METKPTSINPQIESELNERIQSIDYLWMVTRSITEHLSVLGEERVYLPNLEASYL